MGAYCQRQLRVVKWVKGSLLLLAQELQPTGILIVEGNDVLLFHLGADFIHAANWADIGLVVLVGPQQKQHLQLLCQICCQICAFLARDCRLLDYHRCTPCFLLFILSLRRRSRLRVADHGQVHFEVFFELLGEFVDLLFEVVHDCLQGIVLQYVVRDSNKDLFEVFEELG